MFDVCEKPSTFFLFNWRVVTPSITYEKLYIENEKFFSTSQKIKQKWSKNIIQLHKSSPLRLLTNYHQL